MTDHGTTGRKIIHSWADDLEPQPAQVQDRLIGQVYPALETEGLDRLPDLRATAEHATLDHPELRRLIDSSYRDAAATVGAGLEPSWPADLLPIVTLDHILADSRIGIRKASVRQIPATDHRAVYAVLTLAHEPSG